MIHAVTKVAIGQSASPMEYSSLDVFLYLGFKEYYMMCAHCALRVLKLFLSTSTEH